MKHQEWFRDWFNSEYYHLLYQHRDEEEAHYFISNLLKEIHLPKESRILDLACGKGRFSKFLADNGYEVIGVDIARDSIREAKKHAGPNLSFYQHDMREPFHYGCIDAVFNFFTSFGYFDTREEHLKTLQNVYECLHVKGDLVIDFLNVYYAVENLISQETKDIDGEIFTISRKYSNGKFYKTISVKNRDYEITEEVWGLTLNDFEYLLKESGFEIRQFWGNYSLEEYEKESSPRLIIHAKKNIHG